MWHYIIALILIVISLTLVKYAACELNRLHQENNVQTVFYFFSLSFTLNSLIFLWGIYNNAITKDGNFNGNIGHYIEKIFHIMLDLNTDMLISITILIVIILSQFLSYILSGFFCGCAASPVLIGTSFKFFMWAVVKTLSTVSGVILSTSIISFIYNWNGWSKEIVGYIIISTIFIFLALFFLLFYSQENIVIIKLKKYFEPLHKWFTRNNLNKEYLQN